MIDLINLSKHFAGRKAKPVVDNVSMKIEEGELCVLLGPSGCGKTTTLKMINRLIQPTSGKILIGGVNTSTFDVVELRRKIGYVIQQVGLFPNMTVEQNIGIVPRMLGWDKTKTRRRAEALLELVALDPSAFLTSYPRDLSGGQQQRVGVARALAADPPVMLMDEPFGAIDPINRASIQDEFRKIQKELRKTVVFVSHDIDEAMKMADKVAIFHNGTLEQFAGPDELLARPASKFIADFVGSDRALKRLRLVRAIDAVMRKDVFLRAGDSLRDARAQLDGHVTDEIVLLSESDVPYGIYSAAQLELLHSRVDDSMAMPVAAVVKGSDDLRTVMSMMLAHGVSWLPVADLEGKFAGYITQQRLSELARAECSAGAAHAGDWSSGKESSDSPSAVSQPETAERG